ncbi:hypothetical protein PFY12_14040 [Chryseobacterium camelliae]|uniref:Uncharacterized protein n=1 Tax=Chryseobacterium camelliae TaxID=1265445 RepID=A0ABY7QMD9_9FLAO|nr:hypothetical protein [Chryseobacterium camelliae]WBV60147.1 hypothetical protein PFY12_14040 [Chryseobacterium camelliae]
MKINEYGRLIYQNGNDNLLTSNTSGIINTAFGVNSLLNNINGTLNTALGYNSLNGKGIQTENVAVGHASMARYNSTSDTNSISGNASVWISSISWNSKREFK